MKPTVCPYLGLIDDPETNFAFPSFRNCCHRSHQVEAVSLEHQSAVCLGREYIQCPMFKNNFITLLPSGLKYNRSGKKKKYVGIALSCMLILFILGLGWWKGGILVQSAAPISTITVPSLQNGDISPTAQVTLQLAIPNLMVDPGYRPTEGQSSITPGEIELSSGQKTPTLFPVDLPTSTSYPYQTTSTATDCVPPSGWVVYIVQPNDSLFNLGIRFGVSVFDLQVGNCMGDTVTIYVGQHLYVPNVATFTPLPQQSPATPTKDNQDTPSLVTKTPSETPVPSPTETQLPTRTYTPEPTNTVLPTSVIPSPSLTLIIPGSTPTDVATQISTTQP